MADSIDTKFNLNDIETLIEAMSDWESTGNADYHVLQMIKSLPMPPEDNEAFEIMSNVKEHFRKREREILANRQDRQEKSVFLKARLMLVRIKLNVKQVFDMAAEGLCTTPVSSTNKVLDAEVVPSQDLQRKLTNAEDFIRDMGENCWKFYQKFLEERTEANA